MRVITAIGTVYVTKDGRVQIYIRSPFDILLVQMHGRLVMLDIKIPENEEEEHVMKRVTERLSGR